MPIDADRLVHGERHAAQRRRVHRAVVLVGPGGVGEEPRDRGLDLAPGRLGARRSCRAMRAGELVGAGGQVLGDVVEDLRASCAPWRRPSPRPACAASTALRMSLRLPSPTSPDHAGRRRRAPAGCSPSRAAPACRRCRAWRCGRWPASGRRGVRRATASARRLARAAWPALRHAGLGTTRTALPARPRGRSRSRGSRRSRWRRRTGWCS